MFVIYTKKRVNSKNNRFSQNISSLFLGNIEVSYHAINRYRLRTNTNKTDNEIKKLIICKLKKSVLISIDKNEEKYTHDGLIFCTKRTQNGVLVKTILLSKTRQMRYFSDSVDHMDYASFECPVPQIL